MMIKPSEIQTVRVGGPAAPLVAATPAQIGPAIPLNHRRYVYSLKGVNQFPGPNVLTVGARENGVVVTVPLWTLAGILVGDIDVDPDGTLTDDSVPLFSVGGQGPLGAVLGISTTWLVATAGDMIVTMRYVDSIGD